MTLGVTGGSERAETLHRVDDSSLLRERLVARLEPVAGDEVVGESAQARDLIPKLRPDVVREKGTIMVHASPRLDALVRQGFELLIEIRHQGGAARSLALATTFLQMLAHDPHQDAAPFVVSVTAAPIRENHPD
jgi:hypothetical protein